MRKVIHSVKHVPLNIYPLQPLIFHKSTQDVCEQCCPIGYFKYTEGVYDG